MESDERPRKEDYKPSICRPGWVDLVGLLAELDFEDYLTNSMPDSLK